VPANGLLIAALDARRRGWSIIPVGGDKRPLFGWKEYQMRLPAEGVLYDWFGGRLPQVVGLAVITGAVSGFLAVRDFDSADGYEDWAQSHPRLARSLPTVKTARGAHVYLRGPERFANLDDGEYRADPGHYVLLPPSLHPSGVIYHWLVPPPDGPLPAPRRSGLVPPCRRRERPQL
jgi:hypothetical protein